MSMAENPRAVVGSNQSPDYAQRVTDEMARNYAELVSGIGGLLEKARVAPSEVDSDEVAIELGGIVKDLRDAYTRADAYRTSEKEPFLRSEQAVDAFFFAQMEKLRRRNPRDRTQKAGAADILQARIDDFLERKRLAEEARRRQEAEETARVARQKAEEEARAQQAAETARLAAERARKPENAVARAEEAKQAEDQASAATVEAAVAQDQAVAAHIATLAKPAELSRTRGDGVLLTQRREPYVVVVDRTKLDWTKIAPFFTDLEVDKAVRGWAKVTGHNQPMEGAEIGFRQKGVTR